MADAGRCLAAGARRLACHPSFGSRAIRLHHKPTSSARRRRTETWPDRAAIPRWPRADAPAASSASRWSNRRPWRRCPAAWRCRPAGRAAAKAARASAWCGRHIVPRPTPGPTRRRRKHGAAWPANSAIACGCGSSWNRQSQHDQQRRGAIGPRGEPHGRQEQAAIAGSRSCEAASGLVVSSAEQHDGGRDRRQPRIGIGRIEIVQPQQP